MYSQLAGFCAAAAAAALTIGYHYFVLATAERAATAEYMKPQQPWIESQTTTTRYWRKNKFPRVLDLLARARRSSCQLIR